MKRAKRREEGFAVLVVSVDILDRGKRGFGLRVLRGESFVLHSPHGGIGQHDRACELVVPIIYVKRWRVDSFTSIS